MQNIEDYRQELAARLEEVLRQIEKLGDEPQDPLGNYFHLGQAGGSATTKRLREQKDRYLDKTIDRAVKLVPLYKERDALQTRIQDIDNGKFEKQIKLENKAIELVLKFWEQLKPGDTFTPANKPIIIKRKNKKTVTDINGYRWTRSEVLGICESRIAEIQVVC